ncbi:flagellar protein FliS [Pleomorphomonas oryzae]|uniref:flagellar export chaperone FliS n=1 Tax=Pleomorphomonas oryzae TaxID=261934 RepID=UPI0006891BFE|nr:flagellar protein FliS [Pleomorphomonas oryzae]
MNSPMGHAAAAYRQAAASVHPTVAVVKLYDAILLAILQAIRAREQKQVEECFTKVMRAATILRGLDQALDYDKGGAVAEQLHRVYRSYTISLHLSFGKPDVVRRYRKLYDSLIGLRNAWAKIAGMDVYQDSSKDTQAAPVVDAQPPAPLVTSSAVGFDSSMFLGLMSEQSVTTASGRARATPPVRKVRRLVHQQPTVG